jgi:hypothetical protein
MLHTTKQGHRSQNHVAEHEIGFLAKQWKVRMTKKVPNGYGILDWFMKVNCYQGWNEEVTNRPGMKK